MDTKQSLAALIAETIENCYMGIDGLPTAEEIGGYLEIPPQAQAGEVMTKAVLTEHLSLYFKYFDSDYGDLKKLLNMEPLEITVLKYGTIAAYERRLGEKLSRINPDMMDVTGLLRQQVEPEGGRGW